MKNTIKHTIFDIQPSAPIFALFDCFKVFLLGQAEKPKNKV